jgi:hypothetical protein
MRSESTIGAVLVISVCLLTAGAGTPPARGQRILPPSASGSRSLRVRPDFGKMPVNFIPNLGQLDNRVVYYIQGKDKTIYFGAEGVTFALAASDQGGLLSGPDPAEPARWAVKLDFLGSNPGVRPAGTAETGAVISYFQGKPENWKTGLPAFSRITYANLWPGIDLIYSGTTDRLKSEFIVHPGADPSSIRLAYRGASAVRANEKGSLVVSTPLGKFEEGAPVAYQEVAGERLSVPLTYEVAEDGRYGFSVGAYDRSQSLVLDPVIILYCGYVGGPSFDYSYGIAADGAGNAYIVGYTYSAGSFPAFAGPDLTYNGGTVDAFVAKLNPGGTALVYCGFIGGSGNDYGYGIAVDSLGNAYVAGYTSSKETSFPVVTGPGLTQNGSYDAFVAKVNARGTALDYCGYIGGSGQDYGKAIAVDASGRAYVTGSTTSSETTFPVRGSLGPAYSGGQDVFVARVNGQGTALEYCGYIGGSGEDAGTGIAVDASGNAVLAGQTNSPVSAAVPFPVVVGPGTDYKGYYDVFVAKVNAEGSELLYCGYIGGGWNDFGSGVALDLQGNAYVTGYTSSDESTFPVMTGPSVTHSGGLYDAFVAKVRADGVGLVYCGYIGGSDYDAGTAIAVNGRGYAIVTGYTSSKEDSFPVKIGPSLTHSGSFDAFVAKVDTTGAELGFCGYLGGSEADVGTGVALGPEASGDIYLAGNTYSTESTFPVAVGPDLDHNGSRDGFVAKIDETSITLTAPNGGENWHVGFENNITWHSDGLVGNVRIELSTDSGETWEVIADSTENDGLYTWMVPDAVSTECLVRISEADDGDPSDTSRRVFQINNDPILILTSPNGGEKLAVGSTQTITWKWGGEVGEVMIEYTTDNVETWIEIVASTENDGSYTWVVPDTVSDLCRVRISEAPDLDPTDMSDEVFSIVAGTSTAGKKPVAPKGSATPRVIKGGSK